MKASLWSPSACTPSPSISSWPSPMPARSCRPRAPGSSRNSGQGCSSIPLSLDEQAGSLGSHEAPWASMHATRLAMLPFVLLYILLLAVLAVVSATETATFAVSDAPQKVGRMKEGTLKDVLQTVLVNPIHHLHRTLLVSAALNLALTTLGLFLVVDSRQTTGLNPWLGGCGLFIITVVLGDVLPKFLAARAPGRVLLLTTRILRPVRIILDPITQIVERASDSLLLLLIPKGIKTRQPLPREELETLIEMR